jgi:hypothetical protein
VCREAGGEKRGGRADDLCFYDMARLLLKTEVLHARSPKGDQSTQTYSVPDRKKEVESED